MYSHVIAFSFSRKCFSLQSNIKTLYVDIKIFISGKVKTSFTRIDQVGPVLQIKVDYFILC